MSQDDYNLNDLKEAGFSTETPVAEVTSDPNPTATGVGGESTAVTDPPPATTTDAPVFNESDYLKTNFGDTWKSPSEIKEELEKRGTEAEAAKKAAQELANKYAELENQHNGIFANDFIKAANEFVKKEGSLEIFLEVNKLDLEKMTGEDAIAKQMKIENPDLTDSEISRKISRKYKLGEQYDAEDEDVIDARTDLKLDQKKAKEFLQKYKVDMSVPPQDKTKGQREQAAKDAQIAQQQTVQQWTKVLDEAVGDIKAITIPLNDEGATLQYTFEGYDPKQMRDEVMAVITELKWPVNEQSVAAAKELMVGSIANKKENREKLYKAIAKYSREATDAQWRSEIHNPSAGKQKGDTPTTVAKKSLEEQAIDRYLQD